MTGRPKKSEMLEVRVSHADKEALRAKAAIEGSTVSAVVRRLIGTYLGETAEPPRSHAPGRFAIITYLTTRPLPLTLASCAALLASVFALSPAAHAEARMVEIAIEQRQPKQDGVRLKTAKSVVLLNAEDVICLALDSGEMCHPDQVSGVGPRLLVSLLPLEDGGRVMFRVDEQANADGEPVLDVPFGQTGVYLSEKGDNRSFQVSVHMMSPIGDVSISEPELRE